MVMGFAPRNGFRAKRIDPELEATAIPNAMDGGVVGLESFGWLSPVSNRFFSRVSKTQKV